MDRLISIFVPAPLLSNHPVRSVIRAVLIALAYYMGAWVGINETITPEGLAILWPANAVLLSAFLLLPFGQWWLIALAALVAECIADVPAFPLWAAVAFALINVLETSLAAWLIRKSVGTNFDFNSLKRGAYFLLHGPCLASAFAALFGAAVYVVLDRSDTDYWSLWRLWWFGDALGLLILTPCIVTVWRWLEGGVPHPSGLRLLEIMGLWFTLVFVGVSILPESTYIDNGFHLSPLVLLPFSALAAARFGVTAAALTVTIIAMMAVGFMVRGKHPYTEFSPQVAVWMMQEYLAVVALVSVGLAIMLHEIRKRKNELEKRVLERTLALQRSNEALAEANARLNRLASTDHLTGIANRRHFQDIAKRELIRLASSGSDAALIMFDLDHFKRINDCFGHEAGDTVLRRVVHTVQETVRPMDFVGRFGGEEFLILLPDTTCDTALEIAERVRKRIEGMRCRYDGQTIDVTVSVGVAEWDGAATLDDLIRCADDALYRAKGAGRNQVLRSSSKGSTA